MEKIVYLLPSCPPHYELPFDALITAAWIMLAIVRADLLVAAGSLITARSWGRVVTQLALLLGAPTMLGLLLSLQRQNLALCLIPGDTHYTPQSALRILAYYEQLVAHAAIQAHATFAAIALIAFFGTLAALVTLPGGRSLRWLRLIGDRKRA